VTADTELAHLLHAADQHELDRVRHENTLLRERIASLLEERQNRPTRQQCDYVAAFARDQAQLYKAALARCVILKRKLDERG
jgi:hypothetical protein